MSDKGSIHAVTVIKQYGEEMIAFLAERGIFPDDGYYDSAKVKEVYKIVSKSKEEKEMSDTYTALMQNFSRRISKKVRVAKDARKIASELTMYIKDTYDYDVKVMYDIVEDKLVMLDAYRVENKLDKEITKIDTWLQSIDYKKPGKEVKELEEIYNELRARSLSLAVSGCKTWRSVVNRLKKSGFNYNHVYNWTVYTSMRVILDTDKDKVINIYRRAPHIFDDAGQSLDDIISWFELRRIQQMPLISAKLLCDAYGDDILQILTKNGIVEDKLVEGFYNLRAVRDCLIREGDAVKVVNPEKEAAVKTLMGDIKKPA